MKRSVTLIAVLTALCLAPLAAGDAASDAAGFKHDLIQNINDAESKVLALAEATPQDKYGWKPSPEVRSTSQVYMHVAGGNYFLTRLLGAARPEGLPQDLEAVTDKAQVVAAVKASFAHARKTIEGIPDADLGAKITVPWGEATKRTIMLGIATHAHEHLGQAIAYARSSGVVPPWSKSEG